ncbi:SMC domain protein [Pseudarthrobacter chlorophenolicus A6]|uniref:Nuclease SbcCD subunit C n=1 Tax=Pseudarthrobacter chlorophenolicus (strain ATCC 700700 / DSM 12829 / CIP 107037 / JCM 12360 / KCTC 9906 / NCIMB 13794 / A6) TaxID=452863 RepID=B8HAV6_PSECP|nr:SMC family ATPase [Pseudarthrobacter chlorophenolicus]ACL40270.1 SMC domain protein [Pseudarthrobacter chlorophenolicus A6]SDQ84609.1 exonuclease SbcC [Pseudarthrobacter chlorophenolicus]
MRIHHLRISGFGPFAGTEDVDFDRLSGHGLFLLNGPTGAGKTSVLDAICFALYGSVPGARQDGKRLRSDHAEPSQEPAVNLEFSAQGRRFEVTRSPAWDKPSARGRNGFTTQQAKTLLRERVDGTWVEKSARNDEAGAEITALLGMDRDQFTRVVMLPQGDFAAFLRSKAADRLELLQKLFGTQRFEALEQELSREALAARESVAALSGQLELLTARAESEAASLELAEDSAPAADKAAERLEWLQHAVAQRLEALRGFAEDAETAAAERTLAVDEESGRRERRQRLEAAEARRNAVSDAAPRLRELEARLARHRKAEVLVGQLKNVDGAAAKVASASRAAESALTFLRLAADEDPELAPFELVDAAGTGSSAASLPESVMASAADELGRLRSLLAVVEARLPDEDRLQALRKRHTDLGRKQAELEAAEAKLGIRSAALLEEREGLEAGLAPLELLAGTAALRSKEAASAEELLDVVRRHASAVAARNAVKLRCDAARERQLAAKQQWLDLREERLTHAAAELAAQLQAGDPCPVCGSAEHPAPTAGGNQGPGLAQAEDAAHGAYEAADAALARVGAELANAEQSVAVLAGQGGDTPEEEALAAAGMARTAAAEAERAVAGLSEVRGKLEALDVGIAEAAAAKAEIDAGLAQAKSSLAEVSEQATALDEALSGLRAGRPSLARRLRSLEGAVAVLDKAVAAQAALTVAQSQADDAREQLELALPAAGFATADEARSQLLDSAEADGLQAEVRAGQDEAARVRELFTAEDLVRAAEEKAGGFDPSGERLAGLESEAAEARERARQADLAAGMAARCLASLAAISRDYAALAGSALGPAERARMLAGLADAAAGRGDNTYRMSLNSYVLAARLEQVAIAASERLVAMSDGRYLLQHTDAKAARGAKSGLGLEVVDQWTGHRRDTSTLSGGESFMASLSLALGLADVVQQESGGVEIETLFVDEGFGSLDEQSLEQVMDALEGLRDGGRVVGLVSHVGEMKQRIGTQLQVLKGRTGSTLRISEALDAG